MKRNSKIMKLMQKWNDLNNGIKVKLSYAEVCSVIVNSIDAKKNLSMEEFNHFYDLYNKYQKIDAEEKEVDMNGYYEMCIEIIKKFNEIAPYEKYSGLDETETKMLLDEINNVNNQKKTNDVCIINQHRTADIKRILLSKNIVLSDDEVLLYGNMFEIIAQLTNNKIDNDAMVNAFDELSDLILGKKPSFMAIVMKEQRLKIQIRYMNEKMLLQELNDEEKGIFAYCVWYATCMAVSTTNGSINSGLVDFDTVEHVKSLYDRDKINRPDFFPSNDIQLKEKDEKKDFGFDLDNPIHTTSIANAYKLLKKICYKGEPVHMISQSAINSKLDHLVDLYKLETPSGKKINIYIDSYSDNNSKKLPDGFAYVDAKDENIHNINKISIKNNRITKKELADIAEYREACEAIVTLNDEIQFREDPILLSEKIVNTLNNEITSEYYELLKKFGETKDSDILVKISNLMSTAANQLHKIQYPKSPICQWEFEMYGSPQLFWALEAAKRGNAEGYKNEQRFLSFRGRDSVKTPEGLKKAIEIKFAYEGDSDMQYALYKRYNPSEEHYFNGPAVNKAEKDQNKTDFWFNKLINNPNIKPTWAILELIKNSNGFGVPAAFEKAVELDDPGIYFNIAEYYGINSDIGYSFYVKCALAKEIMSSTACKEILNDYKNKNNKEGFKKFLLEFINQTDAYDRMSSGRRIYEDNYHLFKWLDDVEFDLKYLNYIISHSDEFNAKETKKIKSKHLKEGLFNSKISRKD